MKLGRIEISRMSRLLPGDIRELSSLIDALINSPISDMQKYALQGTRDRLLGEGEQPPSLPLAMSQWLEVLGSSDTGAFRRLGIAVAEAALLAGDHDHAQQLMAAMKNAGARLTTDRASEAVGPGNEKGSTSGIDWHEPDADRFYVLDGQAGIALATVINDLRHASRYVARGIQAPTRLLFVGEPGNGKTEGALHIGRELGRRVALIRLDEVGSSYIAKTAKNLRACFEAAMKENAIVVIDELDGLGTRRDAAGPNVSDEHKKIATAMNQLLDALPQEQIFIGCTNIAGAIDPAIARRLTVHVAFGPPEERTRHEIVVHHWRLMAHSTEAIRRILVLTDGRSGDTVRKVAHEAARCAIRRGEDEAITIADVQAAAATMPRESKLKEPSLLIGGSL